MVYITGDIHGSAEPIYNLFQKFQPTDEDIIVLLGDVGLNYTGQLRDRLIKQELHSMRSTFFCIHGNHEKCTAEKVLLIWFLNREETVTCPRLSLS